MFLKRHIRTLFTVYTSNTRLLSDVVRYHDLQDRETLWKTHRRWVPGECAHADTLKATFKGRVCVVACVSSPMDRLYAHFPAHTRLVGVHALAAAHASLFPSVGEDRRPWPRDRERRLIRYISAPPPRRFRSPRTRRTPSSRTSSRVLGEEGSKVWTVREDREGISRGFPFSCACFSSRGLRRFETPKIWSRFVGCSKDMNVCVSFLVFVFLFFFFECEVNCGKSSPFYCDSQPSG